MIETESETWWQSKIHPLNFTRILTSVFTLSRSSETEENESVKRGSSLSSFDFTSGPTGLCLYCQDSQHIILSENSIS